jgi:hypothetical protein
MDIKLTDGEIVIKLIEHTDEEDSAIIHEVAAARDVAAAQRRKIVKWGDSPCPHVHLTNPNRPRHACDVCWAEIAE